MKELKTELARLCRVVQSSKSNMHEGGLTPCPVVTNSWNRTLRGMDLNNFKNLMAFQSTLQ